MNTIAIREYFRNGHFHWEIVAMLVDEGFEYPDAEWKVISTLKLDAEQVAEMRDAYDNYC